MKPCVECRHYAFDQTYLQAAQGQMAKEPRCSHPEATTRDLVDGIAYCRNERHTKGRQGCGKEGRLWISKAPSTTS